jgi:hypothetical protein
MSFHISALSGFFEIQTGLYHIVRVCMPKQMHMHTSFIISAQLNSTPCHRLEVLFDLVSGLVCVDLFNFPLEILPFHQLRDLIIIALSFLSFLAALLLLQTLIAFCQSSKGGKGVRTELVENAGDQFRKFLVLAVAIDGEGVGGD